MSEQSLKEFLAKVALDEDLARKVKEAGTDVEQMIRLGEENGYEFKTEDLKAVHDEMVKPIGEGLQTFMEKVSTDKELVRKMEEAGTDLDAIIRLGKENGCDFTADNLSAMQNLMVRSDVELSDDDLEKVAGGLGLVIVGGLLFVALAGAVLGGAAAAVTVGGLAYTAGKGGK